MAWKFLLFQLCHALQIQSLDAPLLAPDGALFLYYTHFLLSVKNCPITEAATMYPIVSCSKILARLAAYIHGYLTIVAALHILQKTVVPDNQNALCIDVIMNVA